MVSFRIKFFLVILNLMIVILLFNFVIPSILVFISIIPALIYGIYTKKYFLFLFTFIIFGVILGLFIYMLSTSGIITESIELLVYLYMQLYPYQMNLNLLNLLGIEIIFGISVFIFGILIAGKLMKLDSFKIMMIFSYFIMIFTSFYLIINIFLYLIPQVKDWILGNLFIEYLLLFFYVILPLLVLTLMILFLETIWDRNERKNVNQDVKIINKKLSDKRFVKILKMVCTLFVIVFLIVSLLLILIY